MDYTLFFISALAFLATAAANCSSDFIGIKTAYYINLKDITVQPGPLKIYLPDACQARGATLVGTQVSMCTYDNDNPVVKMLSLTQAYVNSLNGGTVSTTEYCNEPVSHA